MSPKRKVTLYFNAAMLSETQREAIRQDRSVSWIIQAAWKIARDEVRRLPGIAAGASTGNTGGTTPAATAGIEPVAAPPLAATATRRTG